MHQAPFRDPEAAVWRYAKFIPQLHRNRRRCAGKHAWIGRPVPNHRCFRSSPVVRFMGEGTTRPIHNSAFPASTAVAVRDWTVRPFDCSKDAVSVQPSAGPGFPFRWSRIPIRDPWVDDSHRHSHGNMERIGYCRWSRIPIRDLRVDDSHRHSRRDPLGPESLPGRIFARNPFRIGICGKGCLLTANHFIPTTECAENTAKNAKTGSESRPADHGIDADGGQVGPTPSSALPLARCHC